MAERYSYTYDNWGRLLTVTHALSNRGSVPTGEFTYSVSKLLHDYEYDFAGRMVLDKRNGADALKTRFDYNVRSALTGIGAGWNATYQNYGDTFLEILTYHWGGNICSMDWMCGSDGVTRTYNCAYDGLSRLTGAAYSDNLSAPGTYSRGYTYDLHGNILSVATPTDTTAVSHTGNQRSGNFTYDANGNMTADPEAGLTGMTYNVLNLLSGYNAANNRQVVLTYSASGEKLSEQEKVSGLIESEKKYFGNLVYEGLALYPNRLLIDGGYVDITTNATGSSSTYTYRYYVQDHLGNNRLVTDDSGTILQTNHYDPYGQLLSDISSTTAVSQYKYGNKEWDATTASYDFGARRYTPSIPRWTTIDPLAEKYYAISPYVYCAGNPVNLVDPWGLDIYRYDKESGTVILFEKNNDPYDQIGRFKRNRKTGEYELKRTKKGKAMTHIDKIEKGILTDQMNFHKNSFIDMSGENAPSLEGAERFLLDFSNMLDKEIAGFYIAEKGNNDIKYVTIGSVSNNAAKEAHTGGPYNAIGRIPGFSIDDYAVRVNYHTHLSRFSEIDRITPSNKDLDFKRNWLKHNPEIDFLIITTNKRINY